MPAALDLQHLVPPYVLYDVSLESYGTLKQDCGLVISAGLGEQNGLMKRSTCTMPISKVHTWLSYGISRPFFLCSPFQEVVGGLRILFR